MIVRRHERRRAPRGSPALPAQGRKGVGLGRAALRNARSGERFVATRRAGARRPTTGTDGGVRFSGLTLRSCARLRLPLEQALLGWSPASSIGVQMCRAHGMGTGYAPASSRGFGAVPVACWTMQGAVGTPAPGSSWMRATRLPSSCGTWVPSRKGLHRPCAVETPFSRITGVSQKQPTAEDGAEASSLPLDPGPPVGTAW